MSIDRIVAKIFSDAKDEVRRIDDEARHEEERIMEEARKKGESEHERILAQGEKEIDAMVRKILSQARMDVRKLVREEREKGISLCFAEAEKELSLITQSSEYVTILRELIIGGLREIDADEVVITATERDRQTIEQIVAELPDSFPRVDISSDCAIAIGGVILASKSGEVTVNNTFEARMERQRHNLAFEISQMLYESATHE
jgi:V/A-type H+-transporting ATPase subunit E